MTLRRLESDDVEEFWEAWVMDLTFFCRHGKLGSQGSMESEKFWTRAAAHAELEARLEEKLDEGFFEVIPIVEKPVPEPNVFLFFFVCMFLFSLFLLMPSKARPLAGVRPNRANLTPEPPHFFSGP